MKTLEMMTKEELILELENAQESFEAALLEIEEMQMNNAGKDEYIQTLEDKLEELDVVIV